MDCFGHRTHGFLNRLNYVGVLAAQRSDGRRRSVISPERAEVRLQSIEPREDGRRYLFLSDSDRLRGVRSFRPLGCQLQRSLDGMRRDPDAAV